jgi:hypothetical protein
VIAGDATGFEMFDALKVAAGDHEYAVPPEAFNVTEEPLQMVAFVPPSAGGAGVTVTTTDVVLLQPLRVPVTV